MEKHHPVRTTELLRQIVETQDKDPDDRISVGEFVARMKDRTFGLGILVFALPNAIPLGIPGISSICAVPIILFSLQLMLGFQQVWLPAWLSRQSISENTFRKSVQICMPALKFIEMFIRPRLDAFASKRAEKFVGLVIAVLAFVIFLPIPFGNFVPSLCMCALAIGILEKDGALILGGIIASFIVVYTMYYVIALFLKAAFHAVMKLLM
jgi:hypothetical protein